MAPVRTELCVRLDLAEQLVPLWNLRRFFSVHEAHARMPTVHPDATVHKNRVSWVLVNAYRVAIEATAGGSLASTADAAHAAIAVANSSAKAKARPNPKGKARAKAKADAAASFSRSSFVSTTADVAATSKLIAWPLACGKACYTAAYAMLKCRELFARQSWYCSRLSDEQRFFCDKYPKVDFAFWVQYGSWSQCAQRL